MERGVQEGVGTLSRKVRHFGHKASFSCVCDTSQTSQARKR